MQHIIYIIIFLFISCTRNQNSAPQRSSSDILSSNMDTTIAPGDNIFQYINGNWLKQNPIPSDEYYWGIYNLVLNETYDKLIKICEDAVQSKSAQGSNQQKIGDYWSMAMDSIRCDSIKLSPLIPYLSKIDLVTDVSSLVSCLSELSSIGANSLFNYTVTQDDKNSDKMSLYFYQGGLGLPNRDYYFNNDNQSKKVREQYVPFIATMLSILNYDSIQSKKYAQEIVALETQLAKKSRKLEDLRDPYKNYNPMSLTQMIQLGKHLNWNLFLEKSDIHSDTFIIAQPEYYTNLDQLLRSVSIDVWKSYMKWHLIKTYAHTLNKEVVNAYFGFYESLLNGAKNQKPRWKLSIDAINKSLGELLGQEYVEKHFDHKAKLRYSNLVENIRESLKNHIEGLSWMNETTKAKALLKLASMSKKVGYPDHWKDLSELKIGKISYCENEIRANSFWIKYNRNKLGKPVDRTTWDMTPQTYNAYYSPANNEIVLPAAIFVIPGFQDEELDDALVYGYAGASTIGHEITHGFDDQGRQYDEKGNLNNWWTKDDETKFNTEARKLVEQYNSYVLLDSLHVNGEATLGENIADLGGLILALDAFKKTNQYKENKTLYGLTPLQRYFMGYALGWLGQYRDESLVRQILSDVHSPSNYRVIGPMVNVKEFYDAFNIIPGDKMYKADSLRITIW